MAQTKPVKLTRRSLPSCEWSFDEQALWGAAQQPGGLLEDGGCRARCSARSNKSIEEGYGRWKSWDAEQGDTEDQTAPEDRITLVRVRAFAADLEKANASVTVLDRLVALKLMAEILNPGKDFSWIYRIAAPIRARSQPARPKRHRLVPIDQLWSLGNDLMHRADEETIPIRRIRTYQDGLLIALAAARPLRLANLTGLVVGRTLVRRGDAWWIQIPAIEVKTRTPIEFPWPNLIIPHLEVYLSQYRQSLVQLRCPLPETAPDALWLTMYGKPMGHRTIYRRITARTREAFGHPISPHLLRDCSVTSIAIEDPAHVRIAAPLLHHRSFSTTEKYYNQAECLEASRVVQRYLLSLRRGTKRTQSFTPRVNG